MGNVTSQLFLTTRNEAKFDFHASLCKTEPTTSFVPQLPPHHSTHNASDFVRRMVLIQIVTRANDRTTTPAKLHSFQIAANQQIN